MQNNTTDSTTPPALGVTPVSKRPAGVPMSVLLTELRSALLDCQSFPQIAKSLLTCAVKHLSPAIVRIDYRDGSQSRVEFQSAPVISAEQARKFSDKWMEPLAVEVQTGPDYSLQTRYFRREDQNLTVVAAPLLERSSGLAEGAISVMLIGRVNNSDSIVLQIDAIATLATMRQAELLAADKRTEIVEEKKPAAVAPEKAASDVSAAAGIGRIASHSSPKEFAYSLVNSLCNQLTAEQAVFGTAEDGRVRILAISGIYDFKPASPGVAMMQQAMEECLDHGSLILHQPETASAARFAIHRRWSTETGGGCLLSIPLSDAEGIVGILSLRRSGIRPFAKEEVAAVLQVLQPCGAGLRILQKASKPLTQQLRGAAGSWVSQTFGKNSFGRKIAAGFLILTMLWCLFGTVYYRPLCAARVVSENMVQITSSFEAKLRAVHVQPGEQVRAGQLLAEFDTVDLTLQLQALDRDIAATEVEVRRAVDARDTGSAALAKARAGVLIMQAAGIQHRLESARIVAPEDGTIIRADIEKRIGQMFSPGEPILEFAPLGGWVLEIEVPDDIGTLVRPAQTGSFTAASLTSHSMPFEVVSIEGTAQVIDGQNVFVARAPLGERPEWMKSGMEGTARVTTVPKPIWWVGLHRVIDWCRLSFWI